MKKEKLQRLIQQWKKDEKAPFEGWDFSYIGKRVKRENPPWSYINIAKNLVRKSSSLLDIDTGGGEILSKLRPLPKKALAIESYKPNVYVAGKNLKKLGVKVIETDAAKKFPFKDNEFDLILNRHGTINAKEMYRTLNKGGIFFTQQVSPDKDVAEMHRFFHSKPKWTFNNLKYRKKELEKIGFKILKSREWNGKITFYDVGAIVYLLKATPWLIPNFSVDSHLKYLIKLQEKLEKDKKIQFTVSRFLILAKK